MHNCTAYQGGFDVCMYELYEPSLSSKLAYLSPAESVKVIRKVMIQNLIIIMMNLQNMQGCTSSL